MLAGPSNCLRALYESCTNVRLAGRVLAGMAEIAEKSGKSGRIFFSAPFVFTLLHQFLRFWRQIPVLATFLRLPISTDSRLSAGGWVLGVASCLDHQGRVRSGSNGQFSLSRTLRLISHTFPRCPGWVLGSCQSWKGCPSPSESLPAGVAA